MMNKRLVRIAGMILVASVSICGCSNKTAEADRKTITIAAAASLKNCMEEKLIPQFEKKYPDIKVNGVYDSSGKLQIQIEAGLEVDCFFSASNEQMEALEEKGFVNQEDVCSVLKNKLVLIVPKDSSLEIKSFQDVLQANRIAVGDPESVPAGQYAKKALEHMDLWEDVSKKASYGSNVTEVLSWVEAQSADAGFVYQTDAYTSDKVKIVATAPDDALSEAITYPLGIMKASKNQQEARDFLSYIESEEATEVLQDYGFEMEAHR